LSISPEFVEEKSVSDDNRDENSNQVQELAESKVQVVTGKPGPEVQEVVGDHGRFTVLDDISEHVSLEEVPPQRAGHLGESEAEGQQKRQPQVVSGHWSILRCLNLALVHKTSGGLSL